MLMNMLRYGYLQEVRAVVLEVFLSWWKMQKLLEI